MAMVIAITGGVACGKSSACAGLIRLFSATGTRVNFFSCDDAVSNLLTEDDIIRQLVDVSGEQILDSNEALDRSALRDLIFGNSVLRKKIEGILHPQVLSLAHAFLKDSRGFDFSLVEVPLLYEANFPLNRDSDLVIGCSRQTQVKRLREIRKLSAELAEMVLDAQMPIQSKIDRGDFLIWNDGSVDSFEDQMKRLADRIAASKK